MQICETVSVDVETQVDVSIDDVLMEFSRRLETAEMNQELPIRTVFLSLVDFTTKLMAKIPQKGIESCPTPQREAVVDRLKKELQRWEIAQ